MNYITKIPKLIKNNLMYLSGLTTATAITFGIGVNAHADTNNIIYSFSSESVRHWQFVSDGVMGGISTGKLQFEEDDGIKFGRLTGTVSTENNGGFIQVRSPVAWEAAKDKTGIKLTVKGNGDLYYLHIRSTNTRLPWHYYQQSFQANGSWNEVRLPFEAFVKSSSLMRTTLNQSKIKTIGIVAYGKDYKANVSVKSLEFY